MIGVSAVGPIEGEGRLLELRLRARSPSLPPAATSATTRGRPRNPNAGVPNLILAAYPKNVADEFGDLNPDGTPNTPFVVRDCRGSTCAYYQYIQGTSMASPHAVGVAALIVSEFGKRSHDGIEPEPVPHAGVSSRRSATDTPCPTPNPFSYADKGRPPRLQRVLRRDARLQRVLRARDRRRTRCGHQRPGRRLTSAAIAALGRATKPFPAPKCHLAYADGVPTRDCIACDVRESAGKNDSIDSSATVTSIAVPNVVFVLMNASSVSSCRRRSGTAMSPKAGSRCWRRAAVGIGGELVVQHAECRVGARRARHGRGVRAGGLATGAD